MCWGKVSLEKEVDLDSKLCVFDLDKSLTSHFFILKKSSPKAVSSFITMWFTFSLHKDIPVVSLSLSMYPVLSSSVPVLGKIVQEVKFIFKYRSLLQDFFHISVVLPAYYPSLCPWLDVFSYNISHFSDLKIYCCFGYLHDGLPSNHIKMSYIVKFLRLNIIWQKLLMGFDLIANFQVVAVAI